MVPLATPLMVEQNEFMTRQPHILFDFIWFELIVLFYMDSLNKTRSVCYIKAHEAKQTLNKDIGPVNRVHLTVLVSVENIYILSIA